MQFKNMVFFIFRTSILMRATFFLIISMLSFTDVAKASTFPKIMTITIGHDKKFSFFTSEKNKNTPYKHLLIGINGYSRDANLLFNALYKATTVSNRNSDTLIIIPIFQVPEKQALACRTTNMPVAKADDLLWQCKSWYQGALASNLPVSSFTAMDTLIQQLLKQMPTIKNVTVAGFSAGGQFVQRYVGFAHFQNSFDKIHYIVADPSSFLYWDSFRPVSSSQPCSNANQWKYGLENLPAYLLQDRSKARQNYINANIDYLEGALDQGTSIKAAYHSLDKSCAARLQGEYRLDRGMHYANYDKDKLAHETHKLTIILDCAHSAYCVFTSQKGRAILFKEIQ